LLIPLDLEHRTHGTKDLSRKSGLLDLTQCNSILYYHFRFNIFGC
jgi:hypothetical protein